MYLGANMRRIQDNVNAIEDRKLLDYINKQDPKSITQAYDELSQIDPEGSTVFSVDGKDRVIPFQTLRSFLKDSNPSFKGQNKVAEMEAYKYENEPSSDGTEDGYYWDDPERGYEHMNPQSKIDKVLSLRKK